MFGASFIHCCYAANLASLYVMELLIKYGKATLPLVHGRLSSAINPYDMKNLPVDIHRQLTPFAESGGTHNCNELFVL